MTRYPIVLSLVIAAGCSGPPVGEVRDAGRVEDTSADVASVDAGGQDVTDVTAPDAPGDAGGQDVADATLADVTSDAADAGRADVGGDTGEAPTDAGADVPVAMDVGTVDTGTVDIGTVDTGTVDVGTPDAGPRDAGPAVMRFEFVSGTPRGSAGGVSMRSVMVWHGRHRGSAGGINYEGWFQ